MKKVLLVILLLMVGYNSKGQSNPPLTLPSLYIDFQQNFYGQEPMSKAILNNGERIFMFFSLLLGNSDLADPAGVELKLNQIEGTTVVTVPLANLATYLAGRPLLNTVQIRQEYGALTSTLQRVAYFNDEERNIFVVEKSIRNQTATITQVWWSNARF